MTAGGCGCPPTETASGAGGVHHVFVNVTDLGRAREFYGWLMPRLGFPGLTDAGKVVGWYSDGGSFWIKQAAAVEPFHKDRVGLADRVDTLVGCFLAGLKPTGSQDPFALRRGANGAVRIASEVRGLRLDTLAESASEGYRAILGDAELSARWIDRGGREDVVESARQDADVKQAKAQEEEEMRARNCDQAKTHLAALESGNRVARYLPSGERVSLDDSERETAKVEAQKAIQTWCK